MTDLNLAKHLKIENRFESSIENVLEVLDEIIL